jgi:hypothetical protein
MKEMKAKDLLQFLNENVGVGIPHWEEDRLFFFYGTITEVTDTHITMIIPNGIKEIEISKIKQIFLTNNNGGMQP